VVGLVAHSSFAQEPKERATLKGHTGHVDKLTFSADGKMLASGGWDTTVKLWDVATGKELASFTDRADKIWCVAVSPDCKTVAAGSDDGTMTIWDVTKGKRRSSFKGKADMIRSLAFSRDGKTLFSGAESGPLNAWDVATGKEQASASDGERPTQLIVSPDDKVLISCSVDEITAWDTVKLKERYWLKGGDRSTGFTAIAMTSDGKTLASGNGLGTIKFWELATGKELATSLKDRGLCRALQFSGDGKLLASAKYGSIKLWDVATGKELARMIGPQKAHFVAFSPDCKTLASVGGDGVIRLWDVPQASR
jgi:WD40 repeat protein